MIFYDKISILALQKDPSNIHDINSNTLKSFLCNLCAIVMGIHKQWVDRDVGKGAGRFSLDNGAWVNADNSLDLFCEKFQLGWCDQNVRGDSCWEHHFGILFPLDWSGLVTGV